MGEYTVGCSKSVNENGKHKTLEDDVYWTNFKCMRFFLFLPSDFHSQLMIPKKFSENMRNKLPQTVVLKSPGSATASWEVNLVRDNNNLFFGDGWKEFARAHNFKEKDLLVFKYIRESCFKVWVFNEKDSCEKASSYFVRKSVLGKHNNAGENSNLKGNRSEDSSEIEGSDAKDSEIEGSDAEEASVGASRRKTRRQSLRGRRNKAKTPIKPGVPTREPPSEADKERALQMAKRKLTKESFMVVMKTSNVSAFYRLGVPASWARTYLARKNQYMELRANGKKWKVRYNVQQNCGGGVLISGWFQFVTENLLQEFDVCVFTLVSQKDEPAIFDVLICRAAATP